MKIFIDAMNDTLAPEESDDDFPPATQLLRQLNRAAGGNRKDLAAEIGVSYATIHAWCSGARELPDEQIPAIADAALRRSAILRDVAIRALDLTSDQRPERRVNWIPERAESYPRLRYRPAC